MSFVDEWNHPGRPEHPDFWRLSNSALTNDAEAQEYGQDGFERVVRHFVDPHSLVYMAQHRIVNFLAKSAGIPFEEVARNIDPAAFLQMQSAFVDGFLLAARFMEIGAHRDVPG